MFPRKSCDRLIDAEKNLSGDLHVQRLFIPLEKNAAPLMTQLETFFTGTWRGFDDFMFKLLYRSFFCR